MDCNIDIKKDGSVTLAYLPFDARKVFGIPKGTMYAFCTVNGYYFKTKLMSKGGGVYYIAFSRNLLADIGVADGAASGLRLTIEPAVLSSDPEEPEVPGFISNEVLRAISERASIRSFTGEGVTEAEIYAILNAGFCAPSVMNKRPFHFIVSQNRIKMFAMMAHNAKAQALGTAAACIVVCGDTAVQGFPEWVSADCAAAAQNILLAVHSLGLGGVWCGVKRGGEFYSDIVKVFSLPIWVRPIAVIAFGHASKGQTQGKRYETAKVHVEEW